MQKTTTVVTNVFLGPAWNERDHCFTSSPGHSQKYNCAAPLAAGHLQLQDFSIVKTTASRQRSFSSY